MDIGETLRQARESRRLSLDDISRLTNIPRRVLEALEHNDTARVPGGIFARGYLRAYAALVGLDPETIVREHGVQQGDTEEDRSEQIDHLRQRYARESRHAPLAYIAVLAIGLGPYVYSLWSSDSAADAERHASAATAMMALDSDPARPAAAVELPLADVAFAQTRTSGLELQIEPDAVCWVSAISDGDLVLYRLLQSGERVVVEANEHLILRIGDAGAFVYWINGVPGRSIGQPGRAVTVEITASNYRDFFAS